MSILDYITIVFFAISVICMGLAFSKKGQDMKSFFAASGAVPWQMSGLSLFMGFFSAGTFVVWGSIAYSLGWVSIVIQWTMAIAGLLVGSFIAPYWHRTGALTAAEYISKRLGEKTQKMYTFLFLFISLFTTGSFLYPIAKIVEVSTGLPLFYAIILLGGFCVLYVAAGGLWAVVSTDVLQFVILTAAVLIAVPLSFTELNGIGNFFKLAPESFSHCLSEEYSIGFIIAFGIYNTIFIGGNWAYVQRYTSVNSEKDSQKVGWLFGALYIVSPVLWMLPPMIYRILNPSLIGVESEGAYFLACKAVLPSGLLGLMLGGMIFATASSLNATLNIASGVVTNDIFKRIKPKSDEKTLMKIARISTVGFGFLTIVIALFIPLMGGIVNVVISVAALTGVPVYLPVIWTLFSKRQTGRSIVVTTLFSLFVNVFFKFVLPILSGYSLTRSDEMILGVSFPILCLSLFELYYKLINKVSLNYETYKSWEEDNHKSKKLLSDREVSALMQEKEFSQKVIGYAILLTGISMILLGVLTNENGMLVSFVGGLLVILGIYIKKNI